MAERTDAAEQPMIDDWMRFINWRAKYPSVDAPSGLECWRAGKADLAREVYELLVMSNPTGRRIPGMGAIYDLLRQYGAGQEGR